MPQEGGILRWYIKAFYDIACGISDNIGDLVRRLECAICGTRLNGQLNFEGAV